MNIRTEPFEAEHLKAISEHIIEKTYTPEQWRTWADYNAQTTVAITAFAGDEILACAGVRPDGTVWAALHESARKHLRAVLFVAKVWLDDLAEVTGHKEFKAQVAAGFPEGRRLVSHLGFEDTGEQAVCGMCDYVRAA